ncbi:MAG: extensin family protein [Tabrizicola sp.]|nr:extensin family protein [Tabrizicola sp.]
MRGLLLALGLCLGQGAWAQEIDRSPLPPPNPRLTVVVTSEPVLAPVAEAAVVPVPVLAEGGLDRSLRPVPRPKALDERFATLRATSNTPGLDLSGKVADDEPELAALPPPSRKEERRKRRETASRKGSVCGVAAIKGEEIARITSRVKGCGVENPVAVTSVAGVRLSQTATVDCSIAKALNAWVEEVAQPAFNGNLATGLQRQSRRVAGCGALHLSQPKQQEGRQDQRAWQGARHRHQRLHPVERQGADGLGQLQQTPAADLQGRLRLLQDHPWSRVGRVSRGSLPL